MFVTRRAFLTGTAACAASLGAGRAIAPAEELLPVRIATLAIDPSAEALYAQDMGFFKDAGLDAKMTILNNATAIVAAVASGAVDIGFATTPGVALAHQRGIPVRFFAPAAVYTGPVGNTILMALKTSPIKSGADLTGKAVAVSGLKDMTQFETASWIDKTDGDSKSVHFVEMPYPEMTAALEAGRVSAACLIEPFVTTAKSTSKVVANLSDTLGGPYLVGGWIAGDDWLQRNPEAAKRFAGAIRRTAKWANRHTKESAAVLVRYTKITPDVAAAMIRTRYDERAALDPQMLQRPVDMMVRFGALTPMPARDIIAAP
jgi:NitT/TauT family transport system substrate-binding protein